jgi:predicted O-linked N-acetylglucosamine transferase (SPINDLY family)
MTTIPIEQVVLDAMPSITSALLTAALVLRDAGNYVAADAALRAQLTSSPEDGVVLAHLAQVLMLREDAAAEVVLQQALVLAPSHPVVLRNQARWLMRLQQPAAALKAAHSALQQTPEEPESQVLFASALSANGQREAALAQLDAVVLADPDYAQALAIRTSLRYRQGDAVGALSDAQRALALKPHLTVLWPLVASLRMAAADFPGALEAMAHALRSDPDNAGWLSIQGEYLRQANRIDDALSVLTRAVALAPGNATAWANLGTARQGNGETEAAMRAYEKALIIDASQAEVAHNLGVMALAQGDAETALTRFEQALAAHPDRLQFIASRGAALLSLHRPAQEVEAVARQLLALAPRQPTGFSLLGSLCQKLGRFDEAAHWLAQALALAPDDALCLSALGGALKELGRLGEAEYLLNAAIQKKPSCHVTLGKLLFVENYNGRHLPQTLLTSARRYGALVHRRAEGRFVAWPALTPGNGEQPRLRVGLVSGDLRNHPVGYFLESVLQALQGGCLEFFAYTSNPKEDELTARIKPCFAAWTSIVELDDAAAAHLIHSDGVHVLIDLSGHTSFNRLPLFAWKPAPVQASWVGYLATTGMDEIDWQIGDAVATPNEDTAHFSEGVWRMPESYACFTPPADCPAPAVLPALAAGYVTFGSFNNLVKMTDAVVALWARVLNAVPGARLFLKYTQLGDAAVVARTQARFLAHGIGAERLLLEGASPRTELLAAYNRVDLALDPFPYGGGTTTYEALWMAVPVLTQRGNRFLSRVGSSVVQHAGLPEWVASSEDDYVAKAVGFAKDLPRLAALRAGLREQVKRSSLFDAQRFAGHFEKAIWGMWQHWQEQQGEQP